VIDTETVSGKPDSFELMESAPVQAAPANSTAMTLTVAAR
jgi:hypothetical protein